MAGLEREQQEGMRGVSLRLISVAILALTGTAVAITAPGAGGEQASTRLHRLAAARLDVGDSHTCVVLRSGAVRCWGEGDYGALGYGNTSDIGGIQTPDAFGPVDLGAGRHAVAIAAGARHTCGLLDHGQVRCWGGNQEGELGYGNYGPGTEIGDDEDPGNAGPLDLGPGRTATAITAGSAHSCAILDNGRVRCWGGGGGGALGYGDMQSIGNDELPSSAGPVNLGPGRTAVAISAGGGHTCAILDNGRLLCWGDGLYGQLGYGNMDLIGDDETPASAGPVHLGPGRTAVAVSLGYEHTCAILDDGGVRCWGDGSLGRLGYGNTDTIGDNETPGSAGEVDLGPGRTAVAISAGYEHTCAILDNGRVRCWGSGASGRLGYGNLDIVGDNETPAAAGPVDLGPGRTAVAISAGHFHTCALLDNGRVRCWGAGASGRLGYGDFNPIGDNETPATSARSPSVGPSRPGCGRC